MSKYNFIQSDSLLVVIPRHLGTDIWVEKLACLNTAGKHVLCVLKRLPGPVVPCESLSINVSSADAHDFLNDMLYLW